MYKITRVFTTSYKGSELIHSSFGHFNKICARVCSRLKSNTQRPVTRGHDRIAWMDLEMTGLNVRTDKIIEISCLITDNQLNYVAEGPTIAINYPKDVFDNIESEWVRNEHTSNGLIEECLQSQIGLEKAETMVLDFLKEYVAEKSSPLAGNSIYMDRLFLAFHMPRIHDYLHYRIIDVSTIKELSRFWNRPVYRVASNKGKGHRSLVDVKMSIEELRYYKLNFLKLEDSPRKEQEECNKTIGGT